MLFVWVGAFLFGKIVIKARTESRFGSVSVRFGSVRFGFRAHYHYSGKTESRTKSQTESDNNHTAAQIKVSTLLAGPDFIFSCVQAQIFNWYLPTTFYQ